MELVGVASDPNTSGTLLAPIDSAFEQISIAEVPVLLSRREELQKVPLSFLIKLLYLMTTV